MTLALTYAVIALTALTAYPWLRWTCMRTQKQPLLNPRDDEDIVLGTLLADPDAYQHATTLTEGDITNPQHRTAWALLNEASDPCPHDSDRTAPCGCQLTSDQHARAVSSISARNGDTYLNVTQHAANNTEDFISAGERLLGARDDRELSGAVPILLDDEGVPYRDGPQATPSRLWFMTALLGLGFISAIATAIAGTYPNLPATILATLGLITLAYGSTLWAFVDHDTLYIDTPTLIGLGGLSWLFIAASSIVSGEPSRLLLGGAVAVGVVVLFEGTNLLYRLLRGRHGLGGGDAKLAIVTVGAPAAVIGTWNYGYGILLISLVLAIGAYPILRILGHEGRSIPFAFGPYLATGWIAMGLTLPITLLLGNAT